MWISYSFYHKEGKRVSAEENKVMVRRTFEAMNQGDVSVLDELLAPDYVNYGFPGLPPGPEGFKQATVMFRNAFPDFNVVIEDEVAEGDMVASRGTFSGTHQGDFMGIPPTGKHFTASYIDIWRVKDGRLAENWVQMDTMGMMQQLGVMPAPGQ